MSSVLPPDLARALDAPGIRMRLGQYAATVVYREVVGSTNDLALSLVTADAPDGTTVIADQQTAGRGRRGRTWFSPRGGLYLSVVLCRTSSPLITLLAGVAAAEGVKAATGLTVALEWPNDLVTAGTGSSRPRKLGGILCETVVPDAVVVGIGINVARVVYPAKIAGRAASIEEQRPGQPDRGTMLVEILTSLARWRQQVETESPLPLLARWQALSPSCRGAAVAWETPEGHRRGVTAGLDTSGALRVRSGDRIERIVGGTLDWNPARTPAALE